MTQDNKKFSEQKLSRRKLLRAGAGVLTGGFLATALSGCDDGKTQPQTSASPEGPNLYDTLSKYNFMDQDGNQVNADALKAVLNSHYTTLSFGFLGCTAYCPYINPAIGGLHKEKPSNLTSIVVCVEPQQDGDTAEKRNAFKGSTYEMMFGTSDIKSVNKANRNGPNGEKVIFLYPANPVIDKTKPIASQLNTGIVANIEKSFGNIVGDDPTKHTAEIALYAPGGKLLKREIPPLDGKPDAFVAEWTQFLNSQVSQGK